MQQWHLDTANLKMAPQLISLQLKHLVGLYEEVEDMLGKTLAECIDQNYCVQLPNDVKGNLIICSQTVNLEILLVTFRRFILRYLCVEQLNPATELIDYLSDPAMCWPSGAFSDEAAIRAIFPKHLCVGHTYHAYSFLRDVHEEQEKQKLASAFDKMGPGSSAALPPKPSTKKRTDAKSFSLLL